ncbi:MAG: hypothetical protein JNG86_00215, partial [Verrucomicrobiaceae bacterium]|nr:hypothetical protein [Verrucomicrobiaceae bacterium]
FQQVREERAAIYAGTASALAQTRAVPLPLATARLAGSAQASADTLTNWRSAGSGAEWPQFRLPPGRYMLEFEASMIAAPVAFASSKAQPQEQAAFEFGEVTQLLGGGENRKTFTIAASVDDTTFTPVSSGPLTFTRTPLTLRLSAAAGYPANTIRLRNLRLVPVADAAALPTATAATPAPDAAVTLESAQKDLLAAVQAARQTVRDAYLDQLADLAASRPALKPQVTAETRRVERATTAQDGLPLRASGTAGLDDFEDIREVRLAEGQPAAGDHFDIVRDGKTIHVRLLWLACPPAEGDAKAAAPLARHFGIEIEDTQDIGIAARDFTRAYLQGKPLRLLARPARDGDAKLEALLFVPDVGLYQNILIEHGLGAVQRPSGITSPQINALLDAMSAREQAARRRKPPAGAWALNHDLNGKR